MLKPAILLLLVLPAILSAQAALPALEKEALERYQAKDWPGTIEAYRKVIEQKPSDPWPHYFAGVALQELAKHAEAIQELDTANKLGLPPVQSSIRYARSFAQLGQLDKAFESLDRAITLGFAQKTLLETDALLAPARSDVRFAGLLDRLERAANPCKYQAESRQFDFWIGEWEVFTALAPATAPIAASRIESAENGCTVMEYYTQNGGYTGRSINTYDSAIRKWRQFYVDNAGRVAEYVGELRDGTMYYTSETRPGAPFQSRMTFFNEGADQVRQLVERSADGTTWTKSFEGIYKRKKVGR